MQTLHILILPLLFHLNYAFLEGVSTQIKEQIFEDIRNIIQRDPPPERPSDDDIIANLGPANNFVKLYLINKTDPLEPQRLEIDQPDISDPTATYVILMHGWIEDGQEEHYKTLMDSLLTLEENYAVIRVDWSMASMKTYRVASRYTALVSKLVAEFITRLIKSYGISMENFVVMGHSLGGQMAGLTGQALRANGRTLPRIVALDPSGPLYNKRDQNQRLSSDDAKIVTVVHTDTRNFGFKYSCGSMEFYLNGYVNQPGCELVEFANAIDENVLCSHRRSVEYYAEALRDPKGYMARKCYNYLTYITGLCRGEYISLADLEKNNPGNFYLSTNTLIK